MPGPMGHGRAGAPVEKADDFGGALKELIADGTVQSIIDKYISAE